MVTIVDNQPPGRFLAQTLRWRCPLLHTERSWKQVFDDSSGADLPPRSPIHQFSGITPRLRCLGPPADRRLQKARFHVYVHRTSDSLRLRSPLQQQGWTAWQNAGVLVGNIWAIHRQRKHDLLQHSLWALGRVYLSRGKSVPLTRKIWQGEIIPVEPASPQESQSKGWLAHNLFGERLVPRHHAFLRG